MSESNKIEYLKNSIISERDPKYKDAIISIELNNITDNDLLFLINLYNQLKDIFLRNSLLKKMYEVKNSILKDFFLKTYKKERYLDMKIYAIRGLAQYIDEKEIEPLMNSFLKSLIKSSQTTPYNYQEYESLKGANALPYLIKKYNYSCFKKVFDQLEIQYNNMPDAFKGHFTFDENGTLIQLRTTEISQKMISDFFNNR